MVKSKHLFLLITLFIVKLGFSQDMALLSKYEDTLYTLGKRIMYSQHDFEKYNANEKFIDVLKEALDCSESFEYPFDSLTMVARLMPGDERFKMFNWHVKRNDGTYEYFAIIQAYHSRRKEYRVYELIDKSSEIENPEDEILQMDEWYGAHYYKVIEVKKKRKKYYTLLGWDGNNAVSTKKVIDVMRLFSSGRPRFGSYLFRHNRDMKKRVIFEYSSKTTMSLKYEEHLLDPSKLPDKNTRTLRKIIPFVEWFKDWKEKNRKKRFMRKKKKRDIKKRKRLLEKRQKQKNRIRKTRRTKLFNTPGKENVKKKKMNMIVFDRIAPMEQGLEGLYQFYVPQAYAYDAYVFYDGKWRFVEDVDARNWDMESPPSGKFPVTYELMPNKEQQEKNNTNEDNN